jgi:hypothetical protein
MDAYLEATRPKIGVRKMAIMTFILKMIKLGYFLWIIQLNLKLRKIRSNMLS